MADAVAWPWSTLSIADDARERCQKRADRRNDVRYRALVSDIEADPVKQATSYLLIKNALLTSFGKTKWQMAYALLDHPDLGDRRPSEQHGKDT
jgi:hypothetical protein